MAQRVSQIIDQEAKASRTNPYDSHPSLRDRLSALEKLPAGVEIADGKTIHSFAIIPRLMSDELPAGAWLDTCDKLGIRGLDLGEVWLLSVAK